MAGREYDLPEPNSENDKLNFCGKDAKHMQNDFPRFMASREYDLPESKGENETLNFCGRDAKRMKNDFAETRYKGTVADHESSCRIGEYTPAPIHFVRRTKLETRSNFFETLNRDHPFFCCCTTPEERKNCSTCKKCYTKFYFARRRYAAEDCIGIWTSVEDQPVVEQWDETLLALLSVDEDTLQN